MAAVLHVVYGEYDGLTNKPIIEPAARCSRKSPAIYNPIDHYRSAEANAANNLRKFGELCV